MDYEKIYDKDYFSGKTSFFYKLGYGRFTKTYFTNLYKDIEPFIDTDVSGKVLDIGCAYGLMLDKFPNNFQKFGVDVSEHAITIAKNKLKDSDFIVAGAEKTLPYEDSFFDVVMMHDVIEHLEDPETAVKNVYKVLKPGGIFYITTPNLNRYRKIVFKYADKAEHHISMFGHKKLLDVLESNNFKVVDHWTVWGFLIHTFRFRNNLGIGSVFIVTKPS